MIGQMININMVMFCIMPIIHNVLIIYFWLPEEAREQGRSISIGAAQLFYYWYLTYAAFTHAGFTTRYRTKNLYKNISVLSRSRDIQFVKRIESLLKIAGLKFEFYNLEIRFHKRQPGFVPGSQNR